MTWSPWTDHRVRLAALFAVVSLGLAVRAAAFAVRDVIVAPSLPPTVILDSIASSPVADDVPLERLEALAPFSETRSAAPSATRQAVLPALAPLVLVGTIAGNEPSAVCRLGAGPARILHPGDTLGGWRLHQVMPGRAAFIDGAGVRHELRLSSLGN